MKIKTVAKSTVATVYFVALTPAIIADTVKENRQYKREKKARAEQAARYAA